MKTALDIIASNPGAKTVTRGSGNVYTCQVTLKDGQKVTGYGSSLASAEDTAFHGVIITLR